MKARRLLLVILAMLLWAGCEDDKNERAPEIIIGNYKEMILQPHDTLLEGGYYSPVFFSIDLDNNGMADLEFESVVVGSPGMGGIEKSILRTLHDNVEILGIHSSDTLFWHKTIEINDDAFPVEKHQTSILSCQRIDETDLVSWIDPVFKIRAFNADENMSINSSFLADTFQLKAGSYGTRNSFQVGDTLYYFHEIHITIAATSRKIRPFISDLS